MIAASVAWAGTGVTGGESETLSELLRMITDAFASGNPTLAGVLVVVAGVTAIRKYGPLKFPWLGNKPWPALLVLLMSFASTVAAMMGGGSALGATLWPAMKLAAVAAGGYGLIAHLGGWLIGKWGDKLPTWMRSALAAVLWMFTKPGEKAIDKADKAGAEAVEEAGEPTGAGDADEVA